jgi:hypothetical protein
VKYLLTAGFQSWLDDPAALFSPSLAEFPNHHHSGLQLALEDRLKIG